MSYLEPDHQKLDGLLHLGHFNGDQIGYGDFAVLGLPDVQSHVGVVVQVVDLLIVDLIEGNVEPRAGFFAGVVHDHLERPRQHPSLLAGQEIEQVLLALVGRVVADDGVGLSRSGLPVGEDGGVDALEELLDGIFDEVEYIFLRGLRRQDVVKFHIGVIARPPYL